MRKIFPLRHASGSGNGTGVENPGDISNKDCVRNGTPGRSKSPFRWVTGHKPADEKKACVSSCKREHWCQASSLEGPKKCGTPPSGDENKEGKPVVSLQQEASNEPSIRQEEFEDKQVLSVYAFSNKFARDSSPNMGRCKSGLKSTKKSHPDVVNSLQSPRISVEDFLKQSNRRTSSVPKARTQVANENLDFSRQKPLKLNKFGGASEDSKPKISKLSASAAQNPQSRSKSNPHMRLSSQESSYATPASTNPRPSFNDLLNSRSPRGTKKELPGAGKFVKSALQKELFPPPLNEDTFVSKYLNAKSVAERFAKAIRGTSRSNSRGSPMSSAVSDFSFISAVESVGSDAGIQEAESGEVSSIVRMEIRKPVKSVEKQNKDSNNDLKVAHITDLKVALPMLDQYPTPPKAVVKQHTRESPRFREDSAKDTCLSLVGKANKQEFLEHEKREQESLELHLQDHTNHLRLSCKDLEKKFRMAKERLESVANEMEMAEIETSGDLAERRVQDLLAERHQLAKEITDELKLHVFDQVKATDALVLMKRKLDLCVAILEREKSEVQMHLEEELRRREAEWCGKLRKIQSEETRLKGRVRQLVDENIELQKTLSSMNGRENAVTEKANNYEHQLDSQRRRAEEAEKKLLEARESLASGKCQSLRADDELENLRKCYSDKELENEDLRKLIARLQQLCTDHEKSIQGLWNGLKNMADGKPQERDRYVAKVQQELVRLSSQEQALRRDLHASRSEITSLRHELKGLLDKMKREQSNGRIDNKLSDPEQEAEMDHLKAQNADLREQNTYLSTKLRKYMIDEKEKLDIIQNLERNKSVLEDEKKNLEAEIQNQSTLVQDKEKDLQWLQARVDTLVRNNLTLQGNFARNINAAKSSETELDSELRQSLQISSEQLNFMNEKLEMVTDKLAERDSKLLHMKEDCSKKDDAIEELKRNLSETKRALDSRIERLTGRNEELFRLYNAKEQEVMLLQSRVKEETDLRKNAELDLEHAKDQVKDLQEEIKVQEMHCKLLRERLCTTEVELEQQDIKLKGVAQDSHSLQKKKLGLQNLLEESTQRIVELEKQLCEKDARTSSLLKDLNNSRKDVSRVKDELARTMKQRDGIRQEAEDLGSEALKMSAEVEVLRRRVAKLEEDLLMKEGELSILQGDLEKND